MNKDSMDILNMISFVVGVMNYDENMTQSDKQDLMRALNEQTRTVLDEINSHLSSQDVKISSIMEALYEKDTKTS